MSPPAVALLGFIAGVAIGSVTAWLLRDRIRRWLRRRQ